MKLRPLQIATGVIVGALIGGLAVYQVGLEPVRQIIDGPSASFRRLTTEQKPPSSDRHQQRQAAEQVTAKSLRDQQAQQLRVDQQKSGGSEAVDAAARKERAWAQHYKKPAKCDGNPNNETMTECANDYIRSKQQFDRAYEARQGAVK